MGPSRAPATGSATARVWSFRRLRTHRLERIDLVAARKRQERFVRARTVRQIDLQHALDRTRRILSLDIVEEFAAEHRVRAESAADMDVITLNRIAVVADRDGRRQEADIANVVLRARMMATREMNIDRSVECDARLAPARDFVSVALGVGGGEPAADVAGACD